MSRYLLDTNIISIVTKPVPPESLLAWMAEQADENLFISALTIAEVRRGVLEKPAGRKRDQLEAWFTGPGRPIISFRRSRPSLRREVRSRMGKTNGGRQGARPFPQRTRHDHRGDRGSQ